MSHTDWHGAAAALDPEFFDDLLGYMGDEDVVAVPKRVILVQDEATPTPEEELDEWAESDGGSADDEAGQEPTNQLVVPEPPEGQHEVITGLYRAINRILKEPSKRASALRQFNDYALQAAGSHFDPMVHPEMWTQDALQGNSTWQWWSVFVKPYCPELAYVAIRVCSASCATKYCERNWSVYDRIHSKIRNRLSISKVEKLLYVSSNAKMLRRRKRLAGKLDPAVAWTFFGEGDEADTYSDGEDIVLPSPHATIDVSDGSDQELDGV